MGGRGDGTDNRRVRKDPDRDEDKEPSEYDDYRDYIQKTAPKPDYWSTEAREAWKARHPDWSEPAPDRTALARASGDALALRVYGDKTPPAFSDYAQALQGSEPPINNVAATDRANDFAEAVALYITQPERLKLIAPERFKVIARLMADPEYGG